MLMKLSIIKTPFGRKCSRWPGMPGKHVSALTDVGPDGLDLRRGEIFHRLFRDPRPEAIRHPFLDIIALRLVVLVPAKLQKDYVSGFRFDVVSGLHFLDLLQGDIGGSTGVCSVKS